MNHVYSLVNRMQRTRIVAIALKYKKSTQGDIIKRHKIKQCYNNKEWTAGEELLQYYNI